MSTSRRARGTMSPDSNLPALHDGSAAGDWRRCRPKYPTQSTVPRSTPAPWSSAGAMAGDSDFEEVAPVRKAPSCVVPTLLMDNHKDALAFWRSLQISGAVCVHVDAHLDVSNMRSAGREDAEEMGVDCGNFLYSALREGVVSHLVWVIPPHLAASSPSLLDWTQHELQNWMRLTTTEYRSLRAQDCRVEGTLAGARLTVCTGDDLPELDPIQPVLVDLDVDYFLSPEDEIWQSPIELHERLAHLGPTAITVTCSVEGGHTPPQHRYLGNLGLMCFTGHRDEALVLWNRLQAPPDREGGPSWFLAARLALQACRQGQGYTDPAWDTATSHDSDYRLRPLDMASLSFRREDYDGCLHWLDRVEDLNDQPGVIYHQGLVGCRRGDYEAADRRWQELLEHPVARGGTASHLHEMRGRTLVSLGRDSEALDSFRAALRLVPQNAAVWRQMAQAQQKAGLTEEATRSFRRAVALAPDEQATLVIAWDLARSYVDAGQILLAQAALRQIMMQAEGTLASEARAMFERLSGHGFAAEGPTPSLPAPREEGRPQLPRPEPAIAPPTQELIDLCNEVRKNAGHRIATLETRLQAGRRQLDEARADFARTVERDRDDFSSGRGPIIEAVERGFEAYARAFDWIESFLASGDGVRLWHAVAGLARAARLLPAAQSAYEASVLTSGPSRFPTMNLFTNLALRLQAGQISLDRWKAACQGHRPLFAGICAGLSESASSPAGDGRQAQPILDLLQRMEALSAGSSPGEFAGALQALMQAHVDLETAVGAHHARCRAASPTPSPGANRILLAAQEGRLTPALLEEAAQDLQEHVHQSLSRVRETVRLPARSTVALEEIPRMLEALEAVDEALEALLETAGRISDCELALWQLQDGTWRVHASHEALRRLDANDGETVADLACGLFAPQDGSRDGMRNPLEVEESNRVG